jgi:hypothetical protein
MCNCVLTGERLIVGSRVKVISRRRSLFLAFLDSLFGVVFLKQSLRRIQAASNNVPKSHNASAKGLNNMPLTQKVSFKTMLQRGNRVQVPKVVRWQFKMDSEQVLKVTVNALNGPAFERRVYRQRASIERINSRLKEQLNLNRHRVKGLRRITIHALLCMIAMLLMALAALRLNRVEKARPIVLFAR